MYCPTINQAKALAEKYHNSSTSQEYSNIYCENNDGISLQNPLSDPLFLSLYLYNSPNALTLQMVSKFF